MSILCYNFLCEDNMGKICNICQHENDDNAVICTVCGSILKENNQGQQIYNKIEKVQKKVHSIYRKILIIVIIISAILSVYFVLNKEWIGLALTLLFSIPIILTFLKRILFSKISNTFLTKIDQYNKNKYK